MRKLIAILMLLFLFDFNSVKALSEDFLFIINKVGVPRYNVYKHEINEDIYNLYNVFVYGSPHTVKGYDQRWKKFDTGLWTHNGGKYVGLGERGEYSILGTDYNGNAIYNYYFPLDRVPSTGPDKWKYIYTPGALESWQDKTKYKFDEQAQYMKEACFLFSDISHGQNNPYNQITYGINALSLGLDKARLETCATWKSRGTIYTSIIGETGYQGYAVFAVPPMAENACVSSEINVSDEYVLEEDMNEIIIPINFKATISNVSKYVTSEQVEEINATLYVNGKKCSNKSGSKIMSVGSNYMLVISRNEFPPNSTPYKIKIELKSFVETAFAADGLLQGVAVKEIKVSVKEKYVEPIKDSQLNLLLKQNNKWVVSPLAHIYDNNSCVTEAGRTLVAKIKLAVTSDKISQIQAKIDDKKQDFDIIYSTNNMAIGIIIKLPIDLQTTLYGWQSLRQKTGNYFFINNADIVKRYQSPHKLTIEFLHNNRMSREIIEFDTIDNYIANLNFDISNKTKNYDKSILNIEGWLNEQ